MAERCFLRRASPASIATREMRLLCTAIGTRVASLRMAASCDAKSSRQVDIAVFPFATRPGTGPRTTVRTRRRGERQELKQQSPHASCSTPQGLCQCAAEQAWGAVARRDADARRRIVQRRIAARESGSPFALAHSPT